MAHNSGFGFPIYVIAAIAVSGYFAFAAIQGELGVVTRIQAKIELERLVERENALVRDVEDLSNKTRRLSDGYLDLDLLDERARNVLGMARADELLVR